jgi:hypothetical protein
VWVGGWGENSIWREGRRTQVLRSRGGGWGGGRGKAGVVIREPRVGG